MERSKRDTKSVGDRSELEVIVALARAGCLVSVPFGENRRYDLIADNDGVLFRVQVKTGRLRNGVILFAPWSAHSHRKGPFCRPYNGQIECFAVYCPDVDATFIVPVDDVRMSGLSPLDADEEWAIRGRAVGIELHAIKGRFGTASRGSEAR